jgi:hypothetical protein
MSNIGCGSQKVFVCYVLRIEEAYTNEFEEYSNSIISICYFGIYQLHIVPKIKGKKSSPGSRVGDKIVL